MPSSIKQIILENKFHILPLYSIRLNNTCSCGKADCSSPGKHPLFRYNWKIIASNKPEKVEEWFSLSHKMNFGLATGRKSEKSGKYLVVVDVDAAEHPIIKKLSFTFHSLTPNSRYIRYMEHLRMAFVILRPLAEGEEISINYNGDPTDQTPWEF